MRSTGDAVVVQIVGPSLHGKGFQHITYMRDDFLILWAFWVYDHVLQVDALGKVSPCGTSGRVLWGRALGTTARCAGHALGKQSLGEVTSVCFLPPVPGCAVSPACIPTATAELLQHIPAAVQQFAFVALP